MLLLAHYGVRASATHSQYSPTQPIPLLDSSLGGGYIEFSKFGPKPNTKNETYNQKLRLFAPQQWAQIRHYVEGELSESAGWDLAAAQKEFEASLVEAQNS